VTEATLTVSGDGRFALAGELGYGTVTRLLAAGEQAFAPHRSVVVDMAGVTRCDSAAVALLLEWVRGARARGATLAFRNLPGSIHAIASISDVEQLLPRAD
jgi:phospholipid transport system transporter-binding protein